MNQRLIFLVAAFSLSAIVFALAALRRPSRLFVLLTAFSLAASAQSWSPFLDSSRAVDWSSTGFAIPNYTTNCAIQPTLTANSSGAASANSTAIQNALASCDATHNVVNIPAGTYYVAGIMFGTQGHQVLRGAGASSTYLYITGEVGCNWTEGICMASSSGVYHGSSAVQPGGSNQCAWTAGYAKGSTTITLSSCGSAPVSNVIMTLDQANDTSDTNGIYICDSNTAGCTDNSPGNQDGRIINGVTHSQQQSVYVNSVTSLGGGSYSVSITPGVYFNNIRSAKSPGAWWGGLVQNDGLENVTIDQSLIGQPIGIVNCYQCWIKGIRSLYGGRSHVHVYDSLQAVIRDSYFYESQTPGTSESYGIEVETGTSGLLVENNILQQLTAPIMFGQGSGSVIAFNFGIDNQEGGVNAQYPFYAHNAGSEMNLWEGNNFNGINSDSSTWGSSTNGTFFRNQLLGWQLGKSQYTYPVSLESWSRAFNVVGNVLGQPGYQNTYESYATSTTGGVNGDDTVDTSIYALGWTGVNGWGGCGAGSPPACGPLVRSTLMRWGNWDVVTNGTKWDSTEASPAAVPYVNANYTSSYFGTLAHTLPASLHYNSTPSWWPSGKAWPPIGPDVSSGNVGICNGGPYPGTQATSSTQCAGGTLTSAWSSHVVSLPAQDCFLNVMHGAPDGSGSVLKFDASQCYTSSGTTSGTGIGSPTGLTATVL